MKHIVVSDELHRRLEIASTIKSLTMKDIVENAVEQWERKQRIIDRINDFIRV